MLIAGKVGIIVITYELKRNEHNKEGCFQNSNILNILVALIVVNDADFYAY